jgi:hypothetical protein
MKTTHKFLILLTIILCSCGTKSNSISAKSNDRDSLENKVTPTDSNENDTSTYAFVIGTKFTLKLVQTDSKHYKYTVQNFKEIDYSIDYSETDSLFDKTPVPETIECYFATGTDQTGPFKSVLILRNNTKKVINYEALISYAGRDGFEKTSTTPLFPGARGSELWNNNLSAIVIKNLSVQK